MITLIYTTTAIVFLALVLGLFRKTLHHDPDNALIEKGIASIVGNGRWLDLSQRIFDPSDARWLQEELAFPKIAKALTLGRKQLAIHWLETLQASFNDLIRTPESAPYEIADSGSPAAWRISGSPSALIYFCLTLWLLLSCLGPITD